MRVLCINESGWCERRRFFIFWKRWRQTYGPKYGDECVVIGDSEPDEYGEYYLLEGWSQYEQDGYDKEAFIPLTGSEAESLEQIFEDGIKEIMGLK